VPYSSGILETLPIQLEAGEGPDMARVTQLGVLSKYMLDLRPYLSNPEYWEENFGPFLASGCRRSPAATPSPAS
jgi:alpha-1,4-digalacturonate transport system substrate-binding protein